MTTRNDVLRLVNRAIHESGLSQATIAERLNISQSYISQLLSGHRNLSYEYADAILAMTGLALHTTLVDILDDETPENT